MYIKDKGPILLILLLTISSIYLYYTVRANSSEIEELNTKISTYNATISEMDTVISEQDVSIEELSSSLDRKRDTLASAIHEKNLEIQRLQNNYEKELSLNGQLQDQLLSLLEVNTSYNILQVEYEKLLSDYTMINGPSSTFVSLDDLEINLTISRSVYNYTDEVTGTLTIYYLDGSPFKGRVSFTVSSIEGGTTGWSHNIDGVLHFRLGSPAFGWGPGIYRIRPSWIYDQEGFIIAGPNQTEILEVEIEAK